MLSPSSSKSKSMALLRRLRRRLQPRSRLSAHSRASRTPLWERPGVLGQRPPRQQHELLPSHRRVVRRPSMPSFFETRGKMRTTELIFFVLLSFTRHEAEKRDKNSLFDRHFFFISPTRHFRSTRGRERENKGGNVSGGWRFFFFFEGSRGFCFFSGFVESAGGNHGKRRAVFFFSVLYSFVALIGTMMLRCEGGRRED